MTDLPTGLATTLRMRLGPFPNELDAVRALHRRQEVATPDDQSDVMCAACYIFDEGWPCTVARLIEVVDAQIAEEVAALAAPAAAGLDVERPLADELLDAVAAFVAGEPKSYWLRGPAVKRLRAAYNAVVTYANREPSREPGEDG